jgi:ABC-2 type transport system permease protein
MRTIAITRRIILQIFNDKRSLALILVAPIFLFTLIYLLLGNSEYKAKIAVDDIPQSLVDKIKAQGLTVEGTTASTAKGRDEVKNRQVDAFLYKDGESTVMLFETNDAVKTGLVQKAVQAAVKELSSTGSLEIKFLYGSSDDSLFDSMGYILLGIVSFFIVFIIAGVSFVRERTSQTMERLLMTPVKRWQVVLGYTLGFSFYAVLQSILLLCFVKWVLQMNMAGSVITAGVLMILLSVSAVCIGAFFSIFSNNEFQVMQFIPVVVIPQIFFSGLISLDTLPYHLGAVSKIMPVFYACDALSDIMIKGYGFAKILPDISALAIIVILFFIINILALKKYRRI